MDLEISAAILLVLLATKELAGVKDVRGQSVARFLILPVIPLLVVFVIAAILRIINLSPLS